MDQKTIIIILSILVIFIIFFTWQGKTIFKSILLFIIIMFPKRKFHLPKKFFPKIKKSSYKIKYHNREINPDVYHPDDKKSHPGLVVFVPLAREGKRDLLVVNFLCGLARLGFSVIAPHWPARKMGEMFLTDSEDLDYCIKWFKNKKFVSDDKVGVIAASYGTGPAIIATKYPFTKNNIKYLVLVSGYIDLVETARTAITGEYSYKDIKNKIIPDPYAKYILFYTASKFVLSKNDKNILVNLAKISDKNQYDRIKFLKYKNQLSKSSISIYDWIMSKNSKEFYYNFEKLPSQLKHFFISLTPSKKNLNLNIPVMILHSTNDNLVPITEAFRMNDRIQSKDKTFVLVSAFSHTMPISATLKNIFTIYIPNFFRLVRFIYLMIYYQDKK